MDKITQSSIRKLARQIAEKFNPNQIILFGSYAYGKPTLDSDVDILVIMPFEGRSAYKSAEIATVVKPGFPIDIVVRTPEQIKQRLEFGDIFIREITEKGKVLYEA